MTFERLDTIVARVVGRLNVDGTGAAATAPEAVKKTPAETGAKLGGREVTTKGRDTHIVHDLPPATKVTVLHTARKDMASACPTRSPTSALVISLRDWKEGHAASLSRAGARF